MNNNQAKKKRAIEHNRKYNLSRIRKQNNDWARDNLSYKLSYFVRVTLGNSNPNAVRADMRNYEPKENVSNMSDEKIADCIDYLTRISNELGVTLVWEDAIENMKMELKLDTLEATFVFIRWVEYMDNRKTLAKAINFD